MSITHLADQQTYDVGSTAHVLDDKFATFIAAQIAQGQTPLTEASRPLPDDRGMDPRDVVTDVAIGGREKTTEFVGKTFNERATDVAQAAEEAAFGVHGPDGQQMANIFDVGEDAQTPGEAQQREARIDAAIDYQDARERGFESQCHAAACGVDRAELGSFAAPNFDVAMQQQQDVGRGMA